MTIALARDSRARSSSTCTTLSTLDHNTITPLSSHSRFQLRACAFSHAPGHQNAPDTIALSSIIHIHIYSQYFTAAKQFNQIGSCRCSVPIRKRSVHQHRGELTVGHHIPRDAERRQRCDDQPEEGKKELPSGGVSKLVRLWRCKGIGFFVCFCTLHFRKKVTYQFKVGYIGSIIDAAQCFRQAAAATVHERYEWNIERM